MLLQTFDHPALPRFYDHAPEASPPYIAMAHAPGRPASRLCSPPRLRPAEVAAVGVKLAQVLAVVHARGVLHRDINASNVLIDERGAVTLLDFGAAELDEKFYDVPAGERRYLTPPEARVVIPHGGIGALAWSAPEVRAGSGWTDKSDVYSMGHLLFRLLTGKVPVKGADPPTSPQVYASACPDDLAAAVVSALRVDPRHRPSAAQLAQTLSDALESEEEALARVLAVAPRSGRPALRLVPAGPQVRADWTEHPIPEATSDLDPQVLPDPPMPSTAAAGGGYRTAVHAHGRRGLRAAALGLVALGLLWWGVHTSVNAPSDLAPTPSARPCTVLASPEDGDGVARREPSNQPVLASASPPPPPTHHARRARLGGPCASPLLAARRGAAPGRVHDPRAA
jgi:hypothetical protein